MVDYSQHEITYGQCLDSLQNLEYLNLNGCQKISNEGIEAITNVCPTLKVFFIYWNVRITDMGIKHLVKNCKYVTKLNLSGCKDCLSAVLLTWQLKNISDKSLQLVAENYPKLELLNLTRLPKRVPFSKNSKRKRVLQSFWIWIARFL
ncbi:hypothetical protein I3760_14G078300 [Carya illinoinensis]|nr:hypothetical protein I3760_14G078300 [Carya illinoinensis]